jgi:RHS repeat-associated protein
MLTDNDGTVRDIVSTVGYELAHYKYDAFGNVLSASTSLTRYLYTGREFDATTGLQYNRERWYDPHTGRWLSQDPLGYTAGDSNLYRYVYNSPTNGTDPNGEWLHILAGAGIGGLIGGVIGWYNGGQWNGSAKQIGAGIVGGAIGGGVGAATFGLGGVAAGTGYNGALGWGGTVAAGFGSGYVGTATGSAVGQGLLNGPGNIDWGGVNRDGLVGGAAGAVLAPIGKGLGRLRVISGGEGGGSSGGSTGAGGAARPKGPKGPRTDPNIFHPSPTGGELLPPRDPPGQSLFG